MAILQVAAWLMTTPYSWTPNIIWEVAPRTLSALLFSGKLVVIFPLEIV
jgi:hypothetical protein